MDEHALIMDFALVMVLLLIAPLISARLRLPEIVGLILAGMVVGEHGLGYFHLDTTFQLLGAVGLLYLMFLAGLEINLNDFRRYRKPGLVFGLLTFAIPQTLGMFGARWLLHLTWPQSILLASMFASHTLIPFSIVQRLGLGSSRAVTTTIGATILTDTAALLVLAVIAKGEMHGVGSAAAGIGPWFWIRLGAALALLVYGALRLLPRLGYWFFERSTPDGSSTFIFVLAVTFLTAFAAELAGVEPIIGAFLAGLALSTLVPGNRVLMSRLNFVGHTLFIPFFLFSVGMRVNVRALWTNIDGWTVALFMVVCVTVSKWLASHLAGRMLKYSRDETGLLFGLSVNQAAATLAAVLVGVRVGLFDTAVLNGTILMILVTCLIGPWMTERCGRRIAAQKSATPARLRRETGRVLIPLGSPTHADVLVDLALMTRPDQCTEPIYPLTVVLDGEKTPARVAEAEDLLGDVVAHVVAADAPVMPLTRIDMNVATGILHAATEFRVGTIVLGWEYSRQLFAQSIPERVIQHSHAAVLAFRPGEKLNTVKRLWIIVPPLLERHSGFANTIQLACRIASQSGAAMRFAGCDATLTAARDLPDIGKQVRSADAVTLSRWVDISSTLKKEFQDHDAILLLSVRRGRLAWQPSLERLPGEWSANRPKANLMVLYSRVSDDAEEDASLEAPRPGGGETGATLSQAPVFEIHAPELPGAVHELLDSTFAGIRAKADAVYALLEGAEPIQLSPRIVLLHTHTPHVEEGLVVIGTRKQGFSVPGLTSPPEILVLLLSPSDGSPEQHLRMLAAVAKAARDGSLPSST